MLFHLSMTVCFETDVLYLFKLHKNIRIQSSEPNEIGVEGELASSSSETLYRLLSPTTHVRLLQN